MTLVRYHIEYSSLSNDEKQSLIEKLESISYTGFSVCQDFCSGEFYLTSEEELKSIDFPEGCHLKRI